MSSAKYWDYHEEMILLRRKQTLLLSKAAKQIYVGGNRRGAILSFAFINGTNANAKISLNSIRLAITYLSWGRTALMT